MNDKDIAIATITWARDSEEEALLRLSLKALSLLRYPMFITDGGSSESFLTFLASLPHSSVFTRKGLWTQAKNSIDAAVASGATTILYTEPDKYDFFRGGLPRMLSTISFENNVGVWLAARSANAFTSFPAFQQLTESTINACCKEAIGVEADYCYGPFLFKSALVPHLGNLPASCGWGWRPFLFAMVHRLGLTVKAYEDNFTCPADQQTDDASERIYRMKQLNQNIEGLMLAANKQL